MNPTVTWAGRHNGQFGGGQLSTAESLRLDPEARLERQVGLRGQLRFHSTTDESGQATITNLPAGQQSVHLHCKGYGLANNAGMPALCKVELAPGEVKELAVVLRADGD